MDAVAAVKWNFFEQPKDFEQALYQPIWLSFRALGNWRHLIGWLRTGEAGLMTT